MFVLQITLALWLLINSSSNATHGIVVRKDSTESDYNSPDISREQANPGNPLNFHEVDAYGDDYVDFGAHTGANGAFYWHANFPIEDDSSNTEKPHHKSQYDYDDYNDEYE